MRKLFTLAGGVIVICSAISATAAPLTQKPLAELLGLRTTSSSNTAFASGTAIAPAAKVPSGRAAGLAEATGVTINASVVYPNNAQGMWSYSTTEWNPTRLSIDPEILATGGGLEANGKYYVNRYREVMGFEEIATLNYLTSTWKIYDGPYNGNIDYVATTMAYNPLRDEAYGCFINAERNGYNFVRWNYDRFLPSATICALERPWSGCAFS